MSSPVKDDFFPDYRITVIAPVVGVAADRMLLRQALVLYRPTNSLLSADVMQQLFLFSIHHGHAIVATLCDVT